MKSQSLFHCECLICRKVQSFQGVSRIPPVASQQRELGVSKEIKKYAAVPPTIHLGEPEALMKAVVLHECMAPKYG